MDHVIRALQSWLDVYEESGDDKRAIICIKNAIRELQKYYSER